MLWEVTAPTGETTFPWDEEKAYADPADAEHAIRIARRQFPAVRWTQAKSLDPPVTRVL